MAGEQPWLCVVEPNNELRLFARAEKALTFKTIRGDAEIFGSELELQKWYTLPGGRRAAIFTWAGCCIQFEHKPLQISIDPSQTPGLFDTYTRLELGAEQMAGRRETGPTVLIAGSPNTGKGTLCRLLTNLALNVGHPVVMVDLHAEAGDICIPGTMGLLTVRQAPDPVLGFDNSKATVLNYGAIAPAANPDVYHTVVSELAKQVEASLGSEAYNVIINAGSCSMGKNILHVIKSFHVNAIMVLDHDLLSFQLKLKLPPSVEVVALPRADGVLPKTPADEEKARWGRVYDSLYSNPNHCPLNIIAVKFSDLRLCRVRQPEDSETSSPLRMELPLTKMTLPLVQENFQDPSVKAVRTIHAVSPQDENIIKQQVLGITRISVVFVRDELVHLLTSACISLPGKALLAAPIQCPEDKVTTHFA